jgi:hypothetical protein
MIMHSALLIVERQAEEQLPGGQIFWPSSRSSSICIISP